MVPPTENNATYESPAPSTGNTENPTLPQEITITILSTGGVVLLAFIVTAVILIRKYRQSRGDPGTVPRREPAHRTISGASYTDAPLRCAASDVANATTAEVDRRYIELHPTVQPCPEPRLQQCEIGVPSSAASPSRHVLGGRSLAPNLSACSTSNQPSGTKGFHPLVALLPRREQPLARQKSLTASCSAPIPSPRTLQANGSQRPTPSVRKARQGKPLQDGETSPLTRDEPLCEILDDGKGGNRVRKRRSNGDDYDYEVGSDDAFSDSSEGEAQGATSLAFGYVDMANVVQVALRTASAVLLRQSTSAPEATTGVPAGITAAHRGASFPSTSPTAGTAQRQPAVADSVDDSDCYEVRDPVATHKSGRCHVGGESSTDDEQNYYNCLDEESICAGPKYPALDVALGGSRDGNEMRYNNVADPHLPLGGSRSSVRSTESSAADDNYDYYNVADGAHSPYVNVPPISYWTTAAKASAAAAADDDPGATDLDTVGGP